MRIYFLLFLCSFVATSSFGQKVEFSGQLNTGLSSFTGESTAGSTTMHYIITPENTCGYTPNPYGNKFAVSYGASVQVQWVTQKSHLIGVQAGAESLRSRIDIGGVYIIGSTQYSSFLEHKDASGKTIFKNDFVNLHPYIGQRVTTGAVDIDFSFGPEVGFGMKSTERGEATAQDGTAFESRMERIDPEMDVRARIGMAAYSNHLGLSASCSHGVTNYLRGYDGANLQAYAVVLRLGILYRL